MGRVTCNIAENPTIAEKIRVTKLSAFAGFYCIEKTSQKQNCFLYLVKFSSWIDQLNFFRCQFVAHSSKNGYISKWFKRKHICLYDLIHCFAKVWNFSLKAKWSHCRKTSLVAPTAIHEGPNRIQIVGCTTLWFFNDSIYELFLL